MFNIIHHTFCTCLMSPFNDTSSPKGNQAELNDMVNLGFSLFYISELIQYVYMKALLCKTAFQKSIDSRVFGPSIFEFL